jgi:hypothetical protein
MKRNWRRKRQLKIIIPNDRVIHTNPDKNVSPRVNIPTRQTKPDQLERKNQLDFSQLIREILNENRSEIQSPINLQHRSLIEQNSISGVQIEEPLVK